MPHDERSESPRISAISWGRMEVEGLGEPGGYLVVTSDIAPHFGISAEQLDGLMNRALVGIGNVIIRIEFMKVYNALSGLREEELHVLGKKLDFLASQISPVTSAMPLGWGADPDELTHETYLPGFQPPIPGARGCGVRWTHLEAGTNLLSKRLDFLRLRPDLIPLPPQPGLHDDTQR